MEMVYFTLMAIALYVVSDWILNQIEIRRGTRMPNRSVVFFGIILCLSVLSFGAIQFLAEDPGRIPPNTSSPGAQVSAPATPEIGGGKAVD